MINNKFNSNIQREFRAWMCSFGGIRGGGDKSAWMSKISKLKGMHYGERVGVREWDNKNLSYFSFIRANSIFIEKMETIIFNGGIDACRCGTRVGSRRWEVGCSCFPTFAPFVDIYIRKLLQRLYEHKKMYEPNEIGGRGGGRWA